MADWSHTSPAELMASHLERVASTRRAYTADLDQFARWLGLSTSEAAVERLVGAQRGEARRLLEDWKNHCRAKGLALATTRRRVNSLLGLLSLAHEFDIVPWALRMKLPASKAVRDTRGPKREGVDAMLEAAKGRGDAKGARDHAMLCLLFFSALRASEVLSIDVGGVSLDDYAIQVKPKGQWDKVQIHVPLVTTHALARWLEVRGGEAGPLFISLQPGQQAKARRLSYPGLYRVVVQAGRQAGLRVWPHALRHSAATITEALTGSVGMAMALTRHKDPRSFWAYRDTIDDMLSASEKLADHMMNSRGVRPERRL